MNSPPHISILGLALRVKSKQSLYTGTVMINLIPVTKTTILYYCSGTNTLHPDYMATTIALMLFSNCISRGHKCTSSLTPTFLTPNIVPTKGRGFGPGMFRFLKTLWGHVPYLILENKEELVCEGSSTISLKQTGWRYKLTATRGQTREPARSRLLVKAEWKTSWPDLLYLTTAQTHSDEETSRNHRLNSLAVSYRRGRSPKTKLPPGSEFVDGGLIYKHDPRPPFPHLRDAAVLLGEKNVSINGKDTHLALQYLATFLKDKQNKVLRSQFKKKKKS